VSAAVLQLEGVSKQFDALKVTQNVSLDLQAGARHALIGPNGAGKSTLVNLITGVLKPSSGVVRVAGEDITSIDAAQRVKRGIARTFQINSLFLPLLVIENVALAIAAREGFEGSLGSAILQRSHVLDEASETLASLGLLAHAGRRVGELAYGQRRHVEIALALSLRPKVLLLDEPVAGVPTTESGRLLDLLERLPADVAVLVIEHDMQLVFRFAKRITVLVEGAVLMEGSPEQVRTDSRVRDVYLGRRNHA
jgi:branched-chain amino acid transport system ATP-binding protein